MDVNKARRLKALEEENSRMKRIIADLTVHYGVRPQFYKYRLILNYRVIVKYENEFGALDFRGLHT